MILVSLWHTHGACVSQSSHQEWVGFLKVLLIDQYQSGTNWGTVSSIVITLHFQPAMHTYISCSQGWALSRVVEMELRSQAKQPWRDGSVKSEIISQHPCKKPATAVHIYDSQRRGGKDKLFPRAHQPTNLGNYKHQNQWETLSHKPS